MSDLIKREDAMQVAFLYPFFSNALMEEINATPSADRPIIYGNEHNCIMTMFGECSYAETGCGDCAVVEKVRKALSADRPRGEWIEQEDCWQCSECGDEFVLEVDVKPIDAKMYYCPNCGARMKGADDD